MHDTGTTVPVHDGLFTTGDHPRLVGGRCRACNRHQFPLTTTCPYCSAADIERVELSAAGRLWAWTAVNTAPPGYRGEVPYGFGVVELDELRVITRLTEADPSRLAFGEPMRLVVVPLHTDDDGRVVLSYAFAPQDTPP